MPQDLGNQWRVFDAGNHPQLAATIRAGLDVNREHPLEALYPLHNVHGGIGRLPDEEERLRMEALIQTF